MKANDMNTRAAALLCVFVLLLGIMSGCGKEEKSEPVTLRTMSIMGDDGQKEVYTDLLESYSASHSDVYHMGTVADSSNAYKLNATFEDTYTASKYPHAVYYYTDTGISDLNDYFVPLDEIRQSYPDFASGISEAALECVRSEDGKTYCVPFAGNWTAMAINTGIFQRFSLQEPDNWQELITVSGVLSARGITPIANSPDDSASLLELICAAMGADETLAAVLAGEELPEEDREILLTMFRRYQELCGISSFPDAVLTDELAQAAEKMTTVSGGDVSSADVPELNIPVESKKTDPIELFNAGEAAMIIVDSSELSRLTLEGFRLIMFPDIPGDTHSGRMVGGFDTGWFITRRAYEDKSVCDAVVAFVDRMTDSDAAAGFARLGYLPSASVESIDTDNGLLTLADDADGFVSSRINSVNSVGFARLEQLAAALSMKIITPEQAVDLTADSELKLFDVVKSPEPAIPETTVSDSDVSGQITESANPKQ